MYKIDCPFCNKPEVIDVNENDIRNDYYLKCPECGEFVHIIIETESGIEKCKTIKISKSLLKNS